MQKDETKICPHCGGVAFLVKDTTKIQQGLSRASFESQSYKCEACERTFKTKEQEMQEIVNFQKQRQTFKMEDLRPSKSVRYGNKNKR